MIEFAEFANLLGNFLLVAFVFALAYTICSCFVKDNTLYERTLLPDNDPQKITYYVEPQTTKDPEVFPTVFDEPTVYATFVVPAYNEENRLPAMLDDTLRYLHSRQNADFTWEIIVVDDGSRDRTCDVVRQYASRNPEIRLLKQPVNMGKGAAILTGCSHARGKMILMVDADGATKIDEFGELEKKLLQLQTINKEAIVVGSRAHLEGEQKANRTFIRKFLGLGFHTLIVMSGVRGINDTQCGFKLFSREAARWLFPNQHIHRWCFDPELLVIGRKRGMCVSEVPVEWNEIDGSKMSLKGMIRMAIDLVQIAIFHRTGLWTIKWKGPTQDFSI